MALNLAVQRLVNQQLVRPKTLTAEEVVRWFGAVQSQDFGGAKWAVGQRMPGATDAGLEEAYNHGSILRTHLMRPTWHFVLPEDIRWLLDLTAERVKMAMSSNDKREGLDSDLFSKSNDVLARALEGGKTLDRNELSATLVGSGITLEGNRLSHILAHAELDQVICSGPRRGKQLTYALFSERVQDARVLTREEALAELARRYFCSHGPATLKDFSWWSGLTTTDARKGIESISTDLSSEDLDGNTYWFSKESLTGDDLEPMAALLPNYDEFTVGYVDRSAIYDEHQLALFGTRGTVLNNIVILNGCLAGVWKRTVQGRQVNLVVQFFQAISEPERLAFTAAVKRYEEFLGLPIQLATEEKRSPNI